MLGLVGRFVRLLMVARLVRLEKLVILLSWWGW